MKKIKSITIVGRRWFEKVNGNTYHSAAVYVDGELIGKADFVYGYGSQYEQTAIDILKKDKRIRGNLRFPISTWAREQKITLVNTVTDVGRKKDL